MKHVKIDPKLGRLEVRDKIIQSAPALFRQIVALVERGRGVGFITSVVGSMHGQTVKDSLTVAVTPEFAPNMRSILGADPGVKTEQGACRPAKGSGSKPVRALGPVAPGWEFDGFGEALPPSVFFANRMRCKRADLERHAGRNKSKHSNHILRNSMCEYSHVELVVGPVGGEFIRFPLNKN
jgi:hypothetical protein